MITRESYIILIREGRVRHKVYVKLILKSKFYNLGYSVILCDYTGIFFNIIRDWKICIISLLCAGFHIFIVYFVLQILYILCIFVCLVCNF